MPKALGIFLEPTQKVGIMLRSRMKLCSHSFKGQTFGLIYSTGSVWMEQRKFLSKTLNDIGVMNKDHQETTILHNLESPMKRFFSRFFRPPSVSPV
jgi:hypothetical protein